MADQAESMEEVPTPGDTAATPAVKRSPGHRAMDAREAAAEMAARAHEIGLEAGNKMSGAMRDVINAAAGLAGFAVESARDLVQFMVRRGQMTQEEADKLIREAEAAGGKRAGPAQRAPQVSMPQWSAPPAAPTAAPAPAPAARAAEPAVPAAKKAASAPAKAAPAEQAERESKPVAKSAGKSVAEAPEQAAEKAPAAKTAAKPAAKAPAKTAAKAPAKGAAKAAKPAAKAPAKAAAKAGGSVKSAAKGGAKSAASKSAAPKKKK